MIRSTNVNKHLPINYLFIQFNMIDQNLKNKFRRAYSHAI